MPSNRAFRWKPNSRWEQACLWGSVALAFVAVLLMLATADFSYHFSSGFDLLGMVLFLLIASVSVGLWFMPRRWGVLTLVALAAAYAGSFVALSAAGDYYWSQSGTKRYSHGLSMTDLLIWHPKGIYWEPFLNIYGSQASRGTVVGYFYMPLLWCDRTWCHPTRRFPEDLPFD